MANISFSQRNLASPYSFRLQANPGGMRQIGSGSSFGPYQRPDPNAPEALLGMARTAPIGGGDPLGRNIAAAVRGLNYRQNYELADRGQNINRLSVGTNLPDMRWEGFKQVLFNRGVGEVGGMESPMETLSSSLSTSPEYLTRRGPVSNVGKASASPALSGLQLAASDEKGAVNRYIAGRRSR